MSLRGIAIWRQAGVSSLRISSMKSCFDAGKLSLPLLPLIACSLLLPLAASAGSAVLTNAAEVRALTLEEASRHLAVQFQGTVLEAGGSALDVYDGTTALYMLLSRGAVSDSRLRPGDYVEAVGNTDPGEFAPIVRLTSLRKLGTRPLPEPRQVTFEELASGGLDAQWVEISGIVRYSERSPNNAQKSRIEMVAGGGRLVVRLNTPRVDEPLVDAQVRLRGICYYLVNKNRQAVSPMLSVPPGVPITIEVPAPADGFAIPVRPIASLMRFSPETAYGHRVHVRGVVTCQQPAEMVWVGDGTVGLRVQTQQKETLSPGDEVDVLGFPKQGDYSPMLEDAVFRTRLHGAAPIPVRLAKAEDAFDHDASLVQLDAVIADQQTIQNGWTFTLRAEDGTVFKALLRSPKGEPAPSAVGSRIRVTGICSVVREYKQYTSAAASGLLRPESFQLLLRSPADLVLIEPPPWWTRQRIFWLLGAVAVVSLLVAGAVIALARRRLQKQAAQRKMAEAEFAAILAERNRVAREIHDTLAQGLGAISLHLGLAEKQLGNAANGVKKHLELAHAVTRASLADARNAIFDMRSQVLENGDLPCALEGILHQMTDGTGVRSRMEVLGRARRLPPILENALLRIGQEAITNAEKHAQARQIEVSLEFADKEVRLSVKDDGCGFEADQLPPGNGSFGLVGMRERAQQLQGDLVVNSRPGDGTEVQFTAPAPS